MYTIKFPDGSYYSGVRHYIPLRVPTGDSAMLFNTREFLEDKILNGGFLYEGAVVVEVT